VDTVGLFRSTALILLLVFPAQLLALAYLPCRHGADPTANASPICHAPAVELSHQAAEAGAETAVSGPQDCNKCHMESVFTSMQGSESLSTKTWSAAPPAVPESRLFFYHLYPDALKRPPRASL
jgi:hypothetical protein